MLHKLLLEGNFYDYTLEFNGKIFKIHKHIMNSVLPYFNNLHNNIYNDSNNTVIIFRSLSNKLVNLENMTNIFNDIITSIYKKIDIFHKCSEYSFEELVEFFRLLDYFCYSYDKNNLFELIQNFAKKKVIISIN